MERVKNMVKESVSQRKQIIFTEISQGNSISISTAWRIWFSNKPHAVVPLSETHKAARKTFCEWLLEQPEGFKKHVLWSDKKCFMLNCSPQTNKILAF